MYIREMRIRILKIKNVIASVIGIFLLAVSVAVMVWLISYYWGDWDTIRNAKATPDCIREGIIGLALLLSATISKHKIADAYFYSSYFEGDLDGNIHYSDLTKITGKGLLVVKLQMHCFRWLYMKNYDLRSVDGIKQIVLYSKQCTCECRNCGAVIEKRSYFTGVCPYCKGSDLFAKVLTGDRFYSISNQMESGKKKPEFYCARHLKLKKAGYVWVLGMALATILIASIACIEQIVHYHDQAYLQEVLFSGTSYASLALIKAQIMETIIWLSVLILGMLPLVTTTWQRLKCISTAETCSNYFSKRKSPFFEAAHLPILKKKKHGIRAVKRAICRHYLLHCSFEMHENTLKIALARKIVKDECPSCGAPIVGAVDETYTCRYCGNLIMGVVQKK